MNTLKEIHQIEFADESDEIEANKTLIAKKQSMHMAFSHGEMM
ncbi:hypothetical protein SynSYN20_01278 [Synechococcus sp. SYN20]|nr:hypothetical protein SynSYN20_01278 [Synechococcus sp. SYN20]